MQPRKLTLPTAVLISCSLLALAIVFSSGDMSFTPSAAAEVAGMDAYDLRLDYDFKRAVQHIVEQCHVSGYADEGGYLYAADISC